MKNTTTYAHHYLFITPIFLFINLILCVGVLYPQTSDFTAKFKAETATERSDSKIINLTFRFRENDVILKDSFHYPGYLSKKPNLWKRDWYRINLLNSKAEVIFSQIFQDPTVCFYDDLDSTTGEWFGGFVRLKDGLINLKIPFVHEATRLQVVSPDHQVLWEHAVSRLATPWLSRPTMTQWEWETVIDNGDPDNRIDLVFMGDGYSVADTARFRQDVITILNYLFNQVAPYREYPSYFNVHIIQLISEERGCDHPESNPPIYRNTVLGCYYNAYGIPRLACCNYDTVYAIASAITPFYDKIYVLMNDPVYGGSGGDVGISYNGTYMRWHVNHEFGHSFGYLLDEYLYENNPGYVSGCNCDVNDSSPKWLSWISLGSPGVGAYKGCCYTNYYRPTYNECNMNTLQNQFCVVCAEQITKCINSRLTCFDSYSPLDNPSIELGDSIIFRIEPLNPNSHDLKTYWYIDQLAQTIVACDSFIFKPNTTGWFHIMGAVFDSTDLVLNDPDYLMVDAQEWQVGVYASSDVNTQTGKPLTNLFKLKENYPNPFNSTTIINYYIPIKTRIIIDVYDISGRFITAIVDQFQAEGNHSTSWDGTDEHGTEMASGIYFYTMKSSNRVMLTKKMILLK